MKYHQITPRISKAARALLSWSQADLAEKAGLSSSTVKRLEANENAMSRAEDITKAAIFNALSDAGIEFMNGGEPGVRLRATPQPLASIQPGSTLTAATKDSE